MGGGDACSSTQAAAKLRDGQALMRSMWAALYSFTKFSTHCGLSASWAYAHCHTGHTCGDYDTFVNITKYDDEEAQVALHLIAKSATHYDPEPTAWKGGLAVYSRPK